ncbi:MAG: hydroxymethylglutaryl-CoA lyase [Nanoarchaeota archaeon]
MHNVAFYEVGPRDGLQSLAVLPAAVKIEYINRLSQTGLKNIEVVSFVSPKFIPQMADSVSVVNGITRIGGIVYSALVPNLEYYGRAKESGLSEIAVFLSANETHNQRNLGASIAATKARLEPLINQAIEDGVRVRGYVSTFFGDHKPQDTPIIGGIEICRWLIGRGVYQVVPSDTYGVASPQDIREKLRLTIQEEIPPEKLALHLHTTAKDMSSKVDAALELGVNTLDSSAGGIGGCPADRQADKLIANVDTYQLARYLESQGIPTGLNLDKVEEAGIFINQSLGR